MYTEMGKKDMADEDTQGLHTVNFISSAKRSYWRAPSKGVHNQICKCLISSWLWYREVVITPE